jgi:hypothetical protein
MRPRDKTAEEVAEVARPKKGNPILRAAMQSIEHDREKQDWRDLPAIGAASLVNYASAPVGGQTYDASWLASNTTGAR